MAEERALDLPDAVEELPDGILERVANGMQTLNQRRETILTTVGHLNSWRLADQETQEVLNQFFGMYEHSAFACLILREFDPEAVLNEVIDRELFPEDERNNFIHIWIQIEWIAEGVEPYILGQIGRESTPERELTMHPTNRGPSFEETLTYGVDELHRRRLSITEVGTNLMGDLSTVIHFAGVIQTIQSDLFDEEELAELDLDIDPETFVDEEIIEELRELSRAVNVTANQFARVMEEDTDEEDIDFDEFIE